MVKTASTMVELGTPAPGFSLPATDGSTVSLSDLEGSPVLVMFICNHCPFVLHLREHLAETSKGYQERGVKVIGISSNDVSTHPDDSFEKMVEEVANTGYTFPYLYDESQGVAKAYFAACTPDFFLFDADQRLVYRGQLDGSRPGNDVPVNGVDLRTALDAALSGSPQSPDQLPSLGCNIKWKAGNAPAWFG